MKKNILLFLILFISGITFSQNKASTSIDSLVKNWDYRIYKDTERLKIIDYYPAFAHCGRVKVYAMAICFNRRGETIRIIEICPGPKKFKHEEIVLFYPAPAIPEDKNPYLIHIDRKINPFLEKYKPVRITTYGVLRNN